MMLPLLGRPNLCQHTLTLPELLPQLRGLPTCRTQTRGLSSWPEGVQPPALDTSFPSFESQISRHFLGQPPTTLGRVLRLWEAQESRGGGLREGAVCQAAPLALLPFALCSISLNKHIALLGDPPEPRGCAKPSGTQAAGRAFTLFNVPCGFLGSESIATELSCNLVFRVRVPWDFHLGVRQTGFASRPVRLLFKPSLGLAVARG